MVPIMLNDSSESFKTDSDSCSDKDFLSHSILCHDLVSLIALHEIYLFMNPQFLILKINNLIRLS
jgi:hypothetical protein